LNNKKTTTTNKGYKLRFFFMSETSFHKDDVRESLQ
jgi:hypothetical protein